MKSNGLGQSFYIKDLTAMAAGAASSKPKETTSFRIGENRTLTVKNQKNQLLFSKEIGIGSKEKKSPKYNAKEAGRAITKSRTSQSAAAIAAQIRVRINELYKKLESGEYDMEEVLAAIAHAEQMERAALKRADNLRIEEQAEKSAEKKEKEEKLEELTVVRKSSEKEHQDKIDASKNTNVYHKTSVLNKTDVLKEIEKRIKSVQNVEQKQSLEKMKKTIKETTEKIDELENLYDPVDEMSRALSGLMTPEEIEAMKKRHRAQEIGMIEIADTAYLKMKMDRLAAAQKSSPSVEAYSPHVNESAGTRGVSSSGAVFSAGSTGVDAVSSPSVGGSIDVEA